MIKSIRVCLSYGQGDCIPLQSCTVLEWSWYKTAPRSGSAQVLPPPSTVCTSVAHLPLTKQWCTQHTYHHQLLHEGAGLRDTVISLNLETQTVVSSLSAGPTSRQKWPQQWQSEMEQQVASAITKGRDDFALKEKGPLKVNGAQTRCLKSYFAFIMAASWDSLPYNFYLCKRGFTSRPLPLSWETVSRPYSMANSTADVITAFKLSTFA